LPGSGGIFCPGLREKAAQRGETLEGYLEQLARHEAEDKDGTGGATPRDTPLSDEEFDLLLDDLSAGTLPYLSADFCRADLYADHD
jgi:hypothetical protein